MTEKQELRALTGLRFVAAFYVFLFHVHTFWPLADEGFVSNVLGQGAVGMSLFFVLSGFVLTYQYQDGAKSHRDYFVSRLARVYPIYLVAALITLPWLGVSFDESWRRGVAQTVILVTSNAFLVQAWFPQFFGLWNGGASWSISVEAFCYLALPLLLPKLTSLSWGQQKLVAAGCFALAALPGLVLRFFDAPAPGMFYSLPIFRLPEFVLGCCICIAWSRGVWGSISPKVLVAVLAVAAAYLSWAGPVFPHVRHNWLVIPTIAIAILVLAQERGAIAWVLSSRWLVWLGKVSYCFYSFQAFLLLLLRSHRDALADVVPALGNNVVLLVVCFIALLIMSAAGYYLIEEPCRRWIKTRFSSGQTRTPRPEGLGANLPSGNCG